MIGLTRLNSQPLMLNSDLIKFIENAPDTVITLVTGEKVVVLETADEVLRRIVEFRQRMMSGVLRISPMLQAAAPVSQTLEAGDEPG